VADLINATRSANGRRRLAIGASLTRKAQNWAEFLAAIDRLAHTDLTAGVPSDWRALGENVGHGRRIIDVHRAFLGSVGNRRNILGRASRLGAGYATGHGRVFIVQIFMST
jgi:uncharacterized protein YkwD